MIYSLEEELLISMPRMIFKNLSYNRIYNEYSDSYSILSYPVIRGYNLENKDAFIDGDCLLTTYKDVTVTPAPESIPDSPSDITKKECSIIGNYLILKEVDFVALVPEVESNELTSKIISLINMLRIGNVDNSYAIMKSLRPCLNNMIAENTRVIRNSNSYKNRKAKVTPWQL